MDLLSDVSLTLLSRYNVALRSITEFAEANVEVLNFHDRANV